MTTVSDYDARRVSDVEPDDRPGVAVSWHLCCPSRQRRSLTKT